MDEAFTAPNTETVTTASAESPASATPAGTAAVRRHWGLRIFVAAVVLAIALAVPRYYIIWLMGASRMPSLKSTAREAHKIVISASYDAAYAFTLAAVFILGLVIARLVIRRTSVGAAAFAMFIIAAALSLLAGLMNTQVVQSLGRPFNYQWLYYSDFLQSPDSHTAIQAALTGRLVTAIVSALVAYVLISIFLGRLIDRRTQWMTVRVRSAVIAFGFVLIIVYAAAGHWYLTTRHWSRDKLVNPVYEFAQSMVLNHVPPIFTMKTDIADDDFAPPKPVAATTPAPATRPAIKHVVFYVFESTPAEYLGAYGSKFPVTPNLDRWAKHAAVFENVYAHAPATNKSLFSMMCSAYPWISFKAETEEMSDIALTTLVQQLKSQANMSSALFYSGDLAFQGAGRFATHGGFEFLQDYKQRKTNRKILTNEKWPFLNGTDDLTTTESLIAWLAERRDQPTFSMLWTMQTHYPYFSVGENEPLGPTENLFNIYLNALKYGDNAFGTLMNWLEQEKLLDETLVVVVGDHGEAFGRHGQLSHGNHVYEENCHIPLLLINPRLFNGQRIATIGGVVDLAPTVTGTLGLPPAPTWQGRSLFSEDHPNRTYFFAPWSDYQFGYREGTRKFIYNATKAKYELYDLATDPLETRNIISEHRDEMDMHIKRIAAWVQYQNRMFDRLLKSP